MCICCGYLSHLSKQKLWSLLLMFILSPICFFHTFSSFYRSIKAIISFMRCSFVCCNIFISSFFNSVCNSTFAFSICSTIRISIENIFRSVFREFFVVATFRNFEYILFALTVYCLFVLFTIQIPAPCTIYISHSHETRNKIWFSIIINNSIVVGCWMPFTIMYFHSMDSISHYFSLAQPFYRLFIFQQILLFHFGFL